MSRPPEHEHALLDRDRFDLIACLAMLAATALMFALVWFPSTMAWMQEIDDAVLAAMLDVQSGALTVIARFFDVLGHVWVIWPLRLAVIVYLGVRRRWWHLAAFVSAMVLAEISIGALKNLYDRPRPPAGASLVVTSGFSFPSGHAVAASVTAVSLVVAFFPPGGRHRGVWGAAAALFSFLMALSRVYLGAHWLSDVVAGTLLGSTIAVCTAFVVEIIRERVTGDVPAPQHPAEGKATGIA